MTGVQTCALPIWHKPGQSIDKFIEKYRGTPAVKYRLWESREQRMTYVTINFPVDYNEEKKIFLKDIINETEGVKFSFALMKNIIVTQIKK